MIRFLGIIVFGALQICAAEAPVTKSKVRSLDPLQNGSSARVRYDLIQKSLQSSPAKPGNPWGYIPTNTVAFQEYALAELLKTANLLNKAWSLGMEDPITEHDVTELLAMPQTNGPLGAIHIRDRYSITISEGGLENFRDMHYWPSRFENKPERWLEIAKEKDQLTKGSAEKVVREALTRLFDVGHAIELEEPPKVNQWRFTPDEDGEPAPIPLYVIEWKYRTPKGVPPERAASAVTFQVSGALAKVTSFVTTSRDILKISVPDNYFQMLGLSGTNAEGRLPGDDGRKRINGRGEKDDGSL